MAGPVPSAYADTFLTSLYADTFLTSLYADAFLTSLSALSFPKIEGREGKAHFTPRAK